MQQNLVLLKAVGILPVSPKVWIKTFQYLKQELINTWVHISGNVTKSLFWMDYPITYSVTVF